MTALEVEMSEDLVPTAPVSSSPLVRFVGRALHSLALDVSPRLMPDSGSLDPAVPSVVLLVASERLAETWPADRGGRVTVARALLAAGKLLIEHPVERVPSKRWPALGIVPRRPAKEVSGVDGPTLEILAVRWAARLHFVAERLPI